MRIEDQVCSIELAKQLKRLGVKQTSLFYFCERLTGYHAETVMKLLINKETTIDEIAKYSAFTVAELGEMIPDSINKDFIKSQKKDDEYKIYIDSIDKVTIFFSKKEADARAKTLIHLIENKII